MNGEKGRVGASQSDRKGVHEGRVKGGRVV